MTFTITPALSAIILPAHIQETETRIMKWLHRVYMPLLHWAISHRRIVMTTAGALVVLTFRGADARFGVPSEA